MAAAAIIGVALSSCADSQPKTRDGKIASGPLAAAINECVSKSKAQPGDASRPETWGRSDYDTCMAEEANKSRPANAKICREAKGLLIPANADHAMAGKCILEVL